MRTLIFLTIYCYSSFFYGQQSTIIFGSVKEAGTHKAVLNATLSIEGTSEDFFTDANGYFTVKTPLTGEHTLEITAFDFVPQHFSLLLNGEEISLGTIFLQQDITREKTDNLIALTDGDLLDDGESVAGAPGLLQATRDIFLTRAAFDFGQAFFKVRGYDSQNGTVLLNGIPMNTFFDGRPQWNNWGGLNDVVRNQEFTYSLALNPYTFGGIQGNTNIDTRPSGLRPGTRISGSFSNRTYTGRLMATYSSGLQNNGLAYTVSASGRQAQEGYIEGTLYNAYSFFGAAEYHSNPQHSVTLTAILARNRRGRSAAITEEVHRLKGSQYNPYWGEQDGRIRNSRERTIFEPIFILNHRLQLEKLTWNTGVAYQFGNYTRSRLGYFNAPSPDPTYYRYLPSYYINSPIGANFINAQLAREAFLKNSQIQWEQLYAANANALNNGKAAYVLYNDVTRDNRITLSSSADYRFTERIQLGFGVNFKTVSSENYAEIQDLLGARFHEDIDTFSDTLNDLKGNPTKTEGEKFSYNYTMDASRLEAFGQVGITGKRWSSFAAASFSTFGVQREGLFANERFPENSLGPGDKISFSSLSLKGGGTYFLSGRHWVSIRGAKTERPPTLQNSFINPRENNAIVPNLQKETITTVDVNYFFRLPDLTGRISAFYTKFQHTTDINFFFVDSGLGSDFVQEVVTNLDTLHKGIEIGLEYQASSNVKLSLAGSLGEYVYASNPSVQINFDTAGAEEELIDPGGTLDLGTANLKGLKLAQGPQTALSAGIEYRDPKYWWVGATANYLDDNYISLSTITRTRSFLLDPETGERFPEATDENVARLLQQHPLKEIYLLNLVGGKSWLVDKKYISVFASVNNLFDAAFKTGGYEQNRNGNFGQLQHDNLSGTPSFAPKFWYGYGRTYFLNVALSF